VWPKQSLLAKWLFGGLIAVVLPFALSNLMAYRTTSHSVESQFIELNLQTMGIGMGNMKSYLDGINRMSVSFYYDPTLMAYLQAKEVRPNELLYISNQVESLYHNRTDIRAVRFISGTNGQVYTKYDNSQFSPSFFDRLPPPPDMRESLGERSYEVVSTEDETMLVLHKRLVDYPREDVLGLLSLFVGDKEMGKLMQPLADAANGEAVYIFAKDEPGLLYSSSAQGRMRDEALSVARAIAAGERGSGSVGAASGVYIYVRDAYLDLPITLVKWIPDEVINESANRTLRNSLWIQGASLLLVAVVASLLAYRTIQPIKRLIRSMAQVEAGNFRIPPERSARADEIGLLEQRFAHMVARLDELINKEYRQRVELSTARLKMLQAQINPHFLYNALQSIGTLALRHRVPEISEKLAALGAILRYSMDFTKETVPLGKEIEHIERYMSLQTGRFKNKLAYSLTCPDDARDVPVPKMTLQPIVENSIVHGIEEGVGSGTIHIGIERKPSRLVIRIMDTGKGLSDETIRRLRAEYDSRNMNGQEHLGIGLMNVLNRLRLLYEPEFRWDVASVPYEATVITLSIPVEETTAEVEHHDRIDR